MKDNIYNKEDEYKKEIFDLLSDDFKKTTEDPIILNLLKEIHRVQKSKLSTAEKAAEIKKIMWTNHIGYLL